MTSLIGSYGKYLLSKEYLGGGAFGSVWKGIREGNNFPVAIKQISLASIPSYNIPFIKSEISLLQQMSKFPRCFPHIVCILDAIYTSDYVFIVMEFIEGKSLQDFNLNNNVELFLDIFKQIALGLNQIHSFKVIHRDIKPVNILLSKKMVIKIVDLGLGCSLVPNSEVANCEGLSGTNGYLDPLFLTGQIKTVQYKSDIFAFGMVMYHLLTGKEPPKLLELNVSTVITVLNMVHNEIELTKIPNYLKELLRRMVSYYLEDRPSDSEILKILNSPTGMEVEEEELKSPVKVGDLNVFDLLLKKAKSLEEEDRMGSNEIRTPEEYIKKALQYTGSVVSKSMLKKAISDW